MSGTDRSPARASSLDRSSAAACVRVDSASSEGMDGGASASGVSGFKKTGQYIQLSGVAPSDRTVRYSTQTQLKPCLKQFFFPFLSTQ